jgi:hypothetical protein
VLNAPVNWTAVPWVKLAPTIVTGVPIGPLEGANPVITGRVDTEGVTVMLTVVEATGTP